MFYLCINSISYQLDLLRFTLFFAVESRDAASPKQKHFLQARGQELYFHRDSGPIAELRLIDYFLQQALIFCRGTSLAFADFSCQSKRSYIRMHHFKVVIQLFCKSDTDSIIFCHVCFGSFPVHHWSLFIPPLYGTQSLSVHKKVRSGNHVCDVAAGLTY